MAEIITTPADLDRFAAIGAATELVPSGGPGTPVRPAVYAPADAKNKAFTDKIARSRDVPVPVPGPLGEFDEVRRGADGAPILADAVLLSSEQAEAHRMTDALLDTGIRWGGLYVTAPPREEVQRLVAEVRAGVEKGKKIAPEKPGGLFLREDADTIEQLIVELLDRVELSSWTLAHRHADAELRYATDPSTGKQLWAGTHPVKTAIIAADALSDATWLIRNALNSLLFGYWTSNSGNGIRAKWGRAISAEVFGYGARLIATGTTKSSGIGDISNELLMRFDGRGELLLVDEEQGRTKQEDLRPSVYGLGTVTTSPGFSAVTFEVILRRTRISLAALRRMRFADDPDGAKRTAAVRAVAAAGLYAAVAVSGTSSYLRTDATLVPTGTAWPAHLCDGTKVRVDVDIATARAVLDAALSDLDTLGLGQADPIRLHLSPAVIAVMAKSAAKKGKNNENGE